MFIILFLNFAFTNEEKGEIVSFWADINNLYLQLAAQVRKNPENNSSNCAICQGCEAKEKLVKYYLYTHWCTKTSVMG